MNGFRSDSVQLGRRAREFDELAGRARRVAEELRRALDATGECWGVDEIGRSFAETHLRGAWQALDDVDGLAPRLREVGAKLAGTASDQQQVEARHVEELGRIVGQG